MKLRDIACEFVNIKVGNGRDIWFWYDNCNDAGPLLKEFGSRIVYDTASNRNAKMVDFIMHNEWRKPRPLSIDLIQVLHT